MTKKKATKQTVKEKTTKKKRGKKKATKNGAGMKVLDGDKPKTPPKPKPPSRSTVTEAEHLAAQLFAERETSSSLRTIVKGKEATIATLATELARLKAICTDIDVGNVSRQNAELAKKYGLEAGYSYSADEKTGQAFKQKTELAK